MPFANLTSGRKVVTTAGTAVQLASTRTPAGRVTITALKSNTLQVAIGGSNVLATAGSETGILLAKADQSITFFVDDLSKIWVDAGTSGDGVSYAFEW
jgi:hypothetical protein